MTDKTLLLLALMLAGSTLPALAQQKPDDPAKPRPAVAVAGAAEPTAGEVRKIDKQARKITIKHGEIKSLDMPPMTMVFQVKDAALLETVKAGDKVRFVVEKTDAGAFVITDIKPSQ